MTQFQLMQIALNNDFQARIRYLMVKEALAKLNAASPPSPDILLGQRILDDGEPVFQWSIAALTDATIAAGAHALDGSTITEQALETSVNANWLAFSL